MCLGALMWSSRGLELKTSWATKDQTIVSQGQCFNLKLVVVTYLKNTPKSVCTHTCVSTTAKKPVKEGWKCLNETWSLAGKSINSLSLDLRNNLELLANEPAEHLW